MPISAISSSVWPNHAEMALSSDLIIQASFPSLPRLLLPMLRKTFSSSVNVYRIWRKEGKLKLPNFEKKRIRTMVNSYELDRTNLFSNSHRFGDHGRHYIPLIISTP